MISILARTTIRSLVWRLSMLIVLVSLLIPAIPLPLHAATTDTPVPVVVDNVEQWSVGSGLIYWADTCVGEEFGTTASLKRKPAAGGAEQTLQTINDGAACLTYLFQLASNNGLFYFNDSLDRIERVPLNPPFTPLVVKALTSDQFPVRAFVEADGFLYWAANAGNKIVRLRKNGSGDIETVADTGPSPLDVLVVGSTVYWTDSTGVYSIDIACGALPCTNSRQQFDKFGATTSGHSLVFQFLGGRFGNFRLYWVHRSGSGVNETYKIVYRACTNQVICFVLPDPEGGKAPEPPATFYTGPAGWFIGDLLLANNQLYWTEADQTTVNNPNGEVKRKAADATGEGADTIAAGQTQLDDQIYVANDRLFFAQRGIGINSLPLNASAIEREFQAEALEVTQGIQDLAVTAPLVAEKTTFVRAYGRQRSGPNAPVVEAHLIALKEGVPLPGSPLRPLNKTRALTAGGGFDRANIGDSWNFLLPPNWIVEGSITLKLVIDPRRLHNDPQLGDNELSHIVTFQEQPPVCIMAAPVRTHTPLPSLYDPNVGGMISQFQRRWPVPEAWIFNEDTVEELEVCWWGFVPYPCYGAFELQENEDITNPFPDRDEVIMILWWRAQTSFNPDVCDDIDAPVHFMGMVHADADTHEFSLNLRAYSSPWSNQSWVKLPPRVPNPIPSGWDQMHEGSMMAQAIAINRGRQQILCESPIITTEFDKDYPYPACQLAGVGQQSFYGFDIATRDPIRPDETADFMTFANPTWVSDYTWRALFDSFATASLASTPASVPLAADDGNSVFVSGFVNTALNQGEIALVLVLPTESMPPHTRQTLTLQAAQAQRIGAQDAVYKLRLLGADGTPLMEDRTLLLNPLPDQSEPSKPALFSDLFAQPAGEVAQIQLLADSTAIYTITPGVNPPTVTIQQPAGDALIGTGVVHAIEDSLTIAWTAGDPDPGDILRFTVQYSHDGGAKWHTLAINLPSTPDPNNLLHLTELGSLQGSAPGAGLIRVLASDGYNTTIATSQPFTLQDRPPLPFITAPAEGQTFAAGDAVILLGNATDPETGGLDEDALAWQVDGRDVGPGSARVIEGLAPGSHTAMLAATDPNGRTVAITVTFEIAPLVVPLADAALLDGFCDDTAYGDAASLQLDPYAVALSESPQSTPAQGHVHVLRTADHLWVCFSSLRKGPLANLQGIGPFAGVRIDLDHSRDPLAQPTDSGFFVGENGSVFTMAGDGAGDWSAPQEAQGFAAQVSAIEGSWNAELRIDQALLGGWDHLVSLSFGHHAVSQAGDDTPWPYLAGWAAPDTWATTALGTQPHISELSPFIATMLAPSFTLTVEGSGFVSGTLVLWNGAELPTTWVDDQHLTAQVTTAQLDNAGELPVQARGPAPAHFLSNQAIFVVERPAPVLASLSPQGVLAGSTELSLIVTGNHFATGTQLLWNGTPLATQFISATQLAVQLDADLLAAGQTIGVAVRNPPPDARTSNALSFEIQPLANPEPPDDEPPVDEPPSVHLHLPVIKP